MALVLLIQHSRYCMSFRFFVCVNQTRVTCHFLHVIATRDTFFVILDLHSLFVL